MGVGVQLPYLYKLNLVFEHSRVKWELRRMVNHHLATEREVRKRIEEVEKDEYRLAFMYQLLIAGRISEVCGSYAPRGSDAFEMSFEVNGKRVPAVLFVVKTAKRKGKLRACAIPLNRKYEPWAKSLLGYFQEKGDEHPFMFARKHKTSTTYAQRIAKKAFDGLEWPLIWYLHPQKREKNPSPCGRCKNGINPNCPVCGGKGTYHKRLRVPERWKEATSHVLRKRRTITLKFKYGFDGFDLSAYGGWTEKSQVDTLPGALKHYLYIDIQDAQEAISLLRDMAKTYFPKLLKPISSTYRQIY